MDNRLKYSCSFKILDLYYRIYSDSPKITRFFKRAYSLFKYGKSDTKIYKTYTMKVCTKGKRNIQKLISNANARIYKSWMKEFGYRMIFLHASSVELGESYILFIGGSLSGKSTVAAILRDYRVRVLNDDFTPIECKSHRVLSFPIFSNIRKGNMSNLQRKYWDLFAPYFKRFKMIRRDYLSDMSEREFMAYYSYNRELYNLKSNYRKKKKLIAIFLEREDSNRLEKIYFPMSFKMFINAMHMPIPTFKKSLKSIIKIFGDMAFYILKSNCAEDAVKLVMSNFK